MILQECLPALPGCPWCLLRQVALNGGFGDIKAQFQELSVNPWRAPEWVITCHLSDEIDLLLRDLRPARSVSTLPSPEDSEALPMPADESVRFDDPRGVPPGLEKANEEAQEESVCGPDLELWRGPGGNLQLLSKEQVFETHLSCRPEERETERKERSDHLGLVRLGGVHFTVAKTIRIRYVGGG